MKAIILSACLILMVTVDCSVAAELVVPAGTRIEGVTVFGTFAPAENVNTSNFPLAIRAVSNPVAIGGNTIPLKDCMIIGDVVADIAVKRAFFRASRILCSNSKEPNGTPVKGYAVDSADNKLGMRGIQASETKAAPQRFVEIPPDAKVFIFILDGVSITIK